jgi:tRNA dimethylallyltransferase
LARVKAALQPLAILGPTASGKTALALELALHLPLEIISLDSALIYRGMDIGTAKPTPTERAAVPHHLIDIRNPDEAYSAADFVRDARRLIADIQTRGKLPLIVGGTMMYFRALTQGLNELPMANAAIRQRLDAEAVALGWPALHARLAHIDPMTAQRLPPTDSQRIQRALEVWELTGQPLSSHFTAPVDASDIRIVSLEPTDRTLLHRRIAERFRAMLRGGFLDEVRELRARFPLTPAMPAMRCVGYRQACAYLDGDVDEVNFIEQSVAATRQLAKRQLTWLRAMPAKASFDPFAAAGLALALRHCKALGCI